MRLARSDVREVPEAGALAALALTAIGLLGCGWAVVALSAHHDDVWPTLRWTAAEQLIWMVALGSCLVGALSGGWLLWRLPTNPTGWWVGAGAVGLAGWITGSFTISPLGLLAERTLLPAAKVAFVLAVLQWPTGRLPRRWRRPARAAAAGYLTLSVVAEFLGTGFEDSRRALPALGDLVVGELARPAFAMLLGLAAPALFLAVMVRRRSTLGATARALTWPAHLAAFVLAGTELAVTVAVGAAQQVGGRGGRTSALGIASNVAHVGRFGLVALLLVSWEGTRRRRSDPTGRVELPATDPDEDRVPDVSELLDDPTARLLVHDAPDPLGATATATGATATATGAAGPLGARSEGGAPRPGRAQLPIVDRSGRVRAVVDHDAAMVIGSATRDALRTAVELSVIRRARRQDAEARTADVRSVQRAVLDAQDRSRRRLERDLHDGAQQQLVALTLQASMLSRRRGDAEGRDDDRRALLTGLERTSALVHELIDRQVPSTLDGGLVEGLRAIEATVPVPTTLSARGDLAPGPIAAALWFVAAEAVANSLKHAGPKSIGIALCVEGSTVTLRVADDGRGGLTTVPRAVSERLSAIDATCEIRSDRRGSELCVTVQRPVHRPAGGRP